MSRNPIQDKLQECRDEGFDARMANRSLMSNPYERGTLAWIRWDTGWYECDIQLKQLEKKERTTRNGTATS
jgi:hypothetical protein